MKKFILFSLFVSSFQCTIQAENAVERSERMYNEQSFYKQLGDFLTVIASGSALSISKKMYNPRFNKANGSTCIRCKHSAPILSQNQLASLGKRFGAMYFMAAAAQNVHNYFQEWKNFKNRRITNEDASLNKRAIYF